MCNLYSVTKGQQAIRDLFRVTVTKPAVFRRRPNLSRLAGGWPGLSYKRGEAIINAMTGTATAGPANRGSPGSRRKFRRNTVMFR